MASKIIPKIGIVPIGIVVNEFEQEYSKYQWSGTVSELRIYPKFWECLKGLELFRFLIVVFWMDRAEKERRYACGSLATCLPERPNPVGITFVELVGADVRNGVLCVEGLDALNNTPVLDIKPYKPWSLKRLEGNIPDINMPKPGE